jgi:hypothetical protein
MIKSSRIFLQIMSWICLSLLSSNFLFFFLGTKEREHKSSYAKKKLRVLTASSKTRMPGGGWFHIWNIKSRNGPRGKVWILKLLKVYRSLIWRILSKCKDEEEKAKIQTPFKLQLNLLEGVAIQEMKMPAASIFHANFFNEK